MRLWAILSAVARSVGRDLQSHRSLKTNNFLLLIFLMAYGASQSGVEPKSAYPPLLFLFFILMFPLSADPLDKVPPSRLASWPITRRERLWLRLMSLALSPILWFVLLMMLFKRVRPMIAMTFLATAVLVQVVAALTRGIRARAPGISFLRRFPPFPRSAMIRNNLRQMFTVLDVYLALLLSTGSVLYRTLAANPDPASYPILSLVIMLTMSTYANCLFGLDLASSATTRYRLLPVRGWQVLAAKDVAFLGILVVLTLPLAPLIGLTSGLIALAVGHHGSVMLPVKMRKWRFAGTRVALGVGQAVFAVIFGFSEVRREWPLPVALATYAVSLGLYGWQWERRRTASASGRVRT